MTIEYPDGFAQWSPSRRQEWHHAQLDRLARERERNTRIVFACFAIGALGFVVAGIVGMVAVAIA